MKFILMGLIKSFTKEMGRSPNIGELNLLRREADIIQKQDTVIPFPMGGKDKISPFKPRPKSETEAEMLERMNRQNKESVARLKKKKEKDLGEKLKDYDGDPDAMAGGGLAGALAKLKKKFGKDIIQKGKAPKKSKKKETQDMFREFNRKNKAGGGLAYMLGEPREEMAAGGPALRRLLQFLNEGVGKKGSQGLKEMKVPKQMKFFAEKQGFNPDQARIEYLEQVLESLKADKKLIKGLEPSSNKDVMEEVADSLFKTEFVDKTQSGRFRGLDSEMIDSSIMELEGILKNLKTKGRKLNADGGRIGFKEGGPPNPGRRNFMKLMAGLASIPVLGKFFKPAAKVAKVVPLQNTTTTMPAWFPKFIDKVVNKGVGKKIDADIMKYETKELPGIEVYKHDDGRVFVSGKNDYSKSYEIEYEPPGYELVDEKTGKAVKTKGDFMAQEEVPVNVDPDGNADFDAEVLESVDNILSSDARAMEEFATGKTIKEMKRGEFQVGRAEALADAARKGEDFATGGLAKLLGE